MECVIFQAALELGVEIKGENWFPGDTLHGVFKIINGTNEAFSLANIEMRIGHGNIKKVKDNPVQAIKTLSPISLESDKTIAAGEACSIDWSFTLPDTAPITDKASSLFVHFFDSTQCEKNGLLQLAVEPRPYVSEFLRLFDHFFRFHIKDKKQKQDWIEVKMEPPKSKDFAGVEKLMLKIKNEKEILELHYAFTLKKLDYVKGGEVSMQKKPLDLKYALSGSEFLMGKDMVDQDKVIAHLSSVLNEVKLKTTY